MNSLSPPFHGFAANYHRSPLLLSTNIAVSFTERLSKSSLFHRSLTAGEVWRDFTTAALRPVVYFSRCIFWGT